MRRLIGRSEVSLFRYERLCVSLCRAKLLLMNDYTILHRVTHSTDQGRLATCAKAVGACLANVCRRFVRAGRVAWRLPKPGSDHEAIETGAGAWVRIFGATYYG